MALPNSNISVAMVKSELGASTNDVGQLCIHPNINKWAKYKPVRHSKLSGLNDTDFASVTAGMDIPIVTAHPSSGYVPIMDFYRNNPDFQFGYNRPRGVGGGFNEPYRLVDFRGYDHGASIFYDVEVVPQIVTSPLRVDLYNFDYPYWLDWNILGLGDLYFGAVIVRYGQTSPASLIWAPQPLSGNDNRLNFSLSPIPPTGTQYDIFAVIGEKPLDPEDPDNNDFYVLQDGYRTVTFVRVLNIQLSAEWARWATEWILMIINNSLTGPETLNTCEILIRYADNGPDTELEPLEPGEGYVPLGSLTVPANSYITRGGQEENTLPDFLTRGGKVYFTSQSHPSYNASADIAYS